MPIIVPELHLLQVQRKLSLRLKPKNLSFITHRFYEILHGVYPDPKPRPFASLRVTHCEGFRMTNLHFKVIATQPLDRGIQNLLKTLDSRFHGNNALELKVAFMDRHFLSKPILHRNREEFLKRDSFSAYQ